MDIQIESYTKVPKKEIKEILERELAAVNVDINLSLRKRTMIFRSVDPVLLVASVAAAGTLASGLAALLSAILQIQKQTDTKSIAIKIPGNEDIKISMGMSKKNVEILVSEITEKKKRSKLSDKKDKDKLVIILK